jgi:hypothetical protein
LPVEAASSPTMLGTAIFPHRAIAAAKVAVALPIDGHSWRTVALRGVNESRFVPQGAVSRRGAG